MANDSQQPAAGSGAGKVCHVHCIVTLSTASIAIFSYE